MSDLEGALEKFMAARGNRDLWTLLNNLRNGVSWKNAPKAAVLAEFVEFYKLLVPLSPQGVLPAKKVVSCLRGDASHEAYELLWERLVCFWRRLVYFGPLRHVEVQRLGH